MTATDAPMRNTARTADGWCGDATSVVEFLRPLREQLDAAGVLEVCVNRPGELLVETVDGWRCVPAPEMTQERCMSLATAVAIVRSLLLDRPGEGNYGRQPGPSDD